MLFRYQPFLMCLGSLAPLAPTPSFFVQSPIIDALNHFVIAFSSNAMIAKQKGSTLACHLSQILGPTFGVLIVKSVRLLTVGYVLVGFRGEHAPTTRNGLLLLLCFTQSVSCIVVWNAAPNAMPLTRLLF